MNANANIETTEDRATLSPNLWNRVWEESQPKRKEVDNKNNTVATIETTVYIELSRFIYSTTLFIIENHIQTNITPVE